MVVLVEVVALVVADWRDPLEVPAPGALAPLVSQLVSLAVCLRLELRTQLRAWTNFGISRGTSRPET